MLSDSEIRLVGPGGAGKSTVGALLAERLKIAFLDLDRHFTDRVGDISDYIDRQGYIGYARENVETYCSLPVGEDRPNIVAVSSGFMTYAPNIHPEYSRVRRELEQHPNTFVLLPSLERDVCIAETVRRQIARPFGRSSAEEEAVIHARFEVYMSVPVRKIETMGPVGAIIDEIITALSLPPQFDRVTSRVVRRPRFKLGA
jgi:shikimate kinase